MTNSKNRMFVSYTDNTTTAFNIMFKRGNTGLDKYTVLTKEFVQSFTYLGKSKANINELFEVQDEPQS